MAIIVLDEAGAFRPGHPAHWFDILSVWDGPISSTPFQPCANESERGGCGSPARYQHRYGPKDPLTETWCDKCALVSEIFGSR